MPRRPRIVIPGAPHHITHRGNNGQKIFSKDRHYLKYLDLLCKYCKKYGLVIHGYCLMPNHIHIIGTPKEPTSLARAIGYTHQQYAQYFNYSENRKGHLWESRYFSCPMDEDHFIQALLYVDRNPVRAGLARNIEDYKWSSAGVHMGHADPAGLIVQHEWEAISERYGWDEIIDHEQDPVFINAIRFHTGKGLPLGKLKEKDSKKVESGDGYL